MFFSKKRDDRMVEIIMAYASNLVLDNRRLISFTEAVKEVKKALEEAEKK